MNKKEEEAKNTLFALSIKKKELKSLREELKGLRMAELGRELEATPENVWFEEDSPVRRIGKNSYNFGYDERKLFTSPDTLGENYFRKIVQKIRNLVVEIEELSQKKQSLGLE